MPLFVHEGVLFLESKEYDGNHVMLPEGSWRILGRASELTEEQWREVVEKANDELVDIDDCHWKDYTGKSWLEDVSSPTWSGLSLIRSLGIFDKNPHGEKEQCPEFPYFGARYPDATCIEGFLWDLDKCNDDGTLYSSGDNPICPFCQTESFLQEERDNEHDEDVTKDWIEKTREKYGDKAWREAQAMTGSPLILVKEDK